MLSDVWRDIISIGGFLLTFAGLLYTLRQVWRAKTAAEAAQAAAEATLTESQRDFQRYAAALAHRYINEAKIHVENQEWDRAAMRLNDVADQAAQLVFVELSWQQLAAELRRWANTCSRHATGEQKPFASTKWQTFTIRVQAAIDTCHGPFLATGVAEDDNSGEVH